jgi:hypothetical protein
MVLSMHVSANSSLAARGSLRPGERGSGRRDSRCIPRAAKTIEDEIVAPAGAKISTDSNFFVVYMPPTPGEQYRSSGKANSNKSSEKPSAEQTSLNLGTGDRFGLPQNPRRSSPHSYVPDSAGPGARPSTGNSKDDECLVATIWDTREVSKGLIRLHEINPTLAGRCVAWYSPVTCR